MVGVSFIGAGSGLAVMMCCPATIIKVALIFTVVMSGVWMVLTFISGAIGAGILGAIFFALSLCYAYAVWRRIPFATINLVTSITAIKANLGVAFYAYLIAALAGLWSVCWSVAFVGKCGTHHIIGFSLSYMEYTCICIFESSCLTHRIYISIICTGVFDQTYTCDANNVCTDPNYGYLFLMFVAFFFGHQVLQVR